MSLITSLSESFEILRNSSVTSVCLHVSIHKIIIYAVSSWNYFVHETERYRELGRFLKCQHNILLILIMDYYSFYGWASSTSIRSVITHLANHVVTHTAGLSYCCLDCVSWFRSYTLYYKHRNQTGHDSKREGILSLL